MSPRALSCILAAKSSTAVFKACRNNRKTHSKKNFRRGKKIACKLQNRKKWKRKKYEMMNIHHEKKPSRKYHLVFQLSLGKHLYKSEKSLARSKHERNTYHMLQETSQATISSLTF